MKKRSTITLKAQTIPHTNSTRVAAEYIFQNMYDDDSQNDAVADDFIVAIVVSIAMLVLMIVLVCCFTNGSAITMMENWVNSGNSSDVVYASRALEFQQEEEEKKKENPQERETRLLDAFEKNSTDMVRHWLLIA